MPYEIAVELRHQARHFRFELSGSFLAERDHEGMPLPSGFVRVVADGADVPSGMLAVE